LERLLDEQEEEIAELDGLVARCNAKNEALTGELKTKKRTIMILEEKYALLKGEHGTLRAKNEKLQLKLVQAEEERDMRIMSSTCDNDSAEEDMKKLRNELRDCKESQEALQTIVAEKETALVALANELDSVKRQMKVLKKERAGKEGKLGRATSSEVRPDVKKKRIKKRRRRRKIRKHKIPNELQI
jgi:chromosome segregation ATPase